jgi:hypothetical protein
LSLPSVAQHFSTSPGFARRLVSISALQLSRVTKSPCCLADKAAQPPG